jgi:hypothetical protein
MYRYSEWMNGYVDPLTSSRYAPTDPRYLVRAVSKTFQNAVRGGAQSQVVGMQLTHSLKPPDCKP